MNTWKDMPKASGNERDRRPSSGDPKSEIDASEPRPTPPMQMGSAPAPSPADERWKQILADFVDDPRRALSSAHDLTGEAVQRIIDALNAERHALEQQWTQGGDVSTETMRVCLQQYRALFHRLSAAPAPGEPTDVGEGPKASRPLDQPSPDSVH